ncbi:MAG: hypothetical protein ACP5ER_02375 [Candidatus Bathyarchaeales archaeon]
MVKHSDRDQDVSESQIICCIDCGRVIRKDEVVHCDHCGAPLCRKCGIMGLCSNCYELWEAEIDLEDIEAEDL